MESRVGEDESKNKVAKIIFKEVSSNCPALPLLLNSSLPAVPAAGPAGSSCLLRWADAGGEQLLGKMAVKRSKFAEVPPITVKLVGLKHWEVRASWLFQSGIRCCSAQSVTLGCASRQVTELRYLSCLLVHIRFSREAMTQRQLWQHREIGLVLQSFF